MVDGECWWMVDRDRGVGFLPIVHRSPSTGESWWTVDRRSWRWFSSHRPLSTVGKDPVNPLAVSPVPRWPARARLASLWLSQVARIIADNALRLYLLLRVAAAGPAERGYAWHLLAALLMLPAVVLAPFNGALSNSLPKRWVLTGAAAYCCLIVAAFGMLDGPWIAGWALLAVGAAVYGPTRYALLPAAAADTGIPLTRVNGWIDMGAVSAIVGGLALGVHLEAMTWDGLPAVVAMAIGLNFLAAVTAWPAFFRADVRRPEHASQALAGFFRDAGRIWRDDEARAALLGLAGLRAVVAGATGAFIAVLLKDESMTLEHIEAGGWILGWILLGAAAGSLLAGAQRHPWRALGLVPLGATGLVAGLVVAGLQMPGPAVCVSLGVMAGLINVPLAAAYQVFLPADARGNGMAVRNFADYLLMTAVSVLLFSLASAQLLSPTGQLWLVAGLAAAGAVLAWAALYRELIEQLMEVVLWPLYRVRGHGPGLETFPLRGPLLIVSNHAAWLDPIWLAKALPRELRPMMTSTFYDLPILHWLMKYVARAVRVQYSTFRREAPELQEVIHALDQGDCVVIFPEGSLRKTEERPLRHFGQGVYHILTERPRTPVVVCWIEGNWRSFFSYFKGPPTKNKRLDFWWRIDIAVSAAAPLDPAVLAGHRATRAYLEQRCREMRGVLGLEVPKPDGDPDDEENQTTDDSDNTDRKRVRL
jgi:1-acyl-sn-glycerol-3-phosphate acyltransferase